MDQETSIAKVRNQLSPIVNYFSLRKMLDDNEIEPDKIDKIKQIVDETYQYIQNENMNNLLMLIKNNDIW